ncbi:MAG TPA: hypothetical protein VKA30_10690 [Actinomycetota bacterium]|nr:hypothetical protein [Actinomycetota bacterium]
MQPKPYRTGAFPGERLTFEVAPAAGQVEDDITWAGGDDPTTGSGRRFSTTFATGGSKVVTARDDLASASFAVEICPVNDWLSAAAAFFGPSLDLSRVTVKQSWAVGGSAGTGWTCNSVVRFKRARRSEDLPVEATLIHELTHVWQHQSGQAQLLRGIVEQAGRLFGRDPYDYGGPEGVRLATSLRRFKKEGQAQIVMEYWKSQHGWAEDSQGFGFSSEYVDDLKRLIDEAGIGRRPAMRWTLSKSLDSPLASLVNGVLRVVE